MATTDMTQYSKGEVVKKYEALKGSMKRLRENSQQIGQRGATLVLTTGGGFAAGVLESKIPEFNGIPTGLLAGLGLGLLGAFDGAGAASEQVLSFGAGMAAGSAYNQGAAFGAKAKL